MRVIIFYSCLWRFHQHNQAIPVCRSPSSPRALCAADPDVPCLARSSLLCCAHMAPGQCRSAGVVLHSTAAWAAFLGGTPGAVPGLEIWQPCPRAVGPSGQMRLFLEVFVVQHTVIKASRFSKRSEYFAGYVRKNSGTQEGRNI